MHSLSFFCLSVYDDICLYSSVSLSVCYPIKTLTLHPPSYSPIHTNFLALLVHITKCCTHVLQYLSLPTVTMYTYWNGHVVLINNNLISNLQETLHHRIRSMRGLIILSVTNFTNPYVQKCLTVVFPPGMSSIQ